MFMPDNRGADLVGPATSNVVLQHATLNGTLGSAHDKIKHSSNRLFQPDQFRLTGAGYETRSDKFLSTLSAFTRGSACTGAMIGRVAMAPVDFALGRGKE